ncbi:hypothetical protein AWE51_17845 [Aquimarina aggregata]|uniref:GH16 domain-containing protein n=1 Tax=Aquimarina aggregata TaxID=1642818 RepID=A0A162X4V2_9FLAO|nr:carbohydrate-binding protein [Aquimarina aggregata]KZS38417.1 hypothetical protein AWE51_17845 [Aquimarina aggregata]
MKYLNTKTLIGILCFIVYPILTFGQPPGNGWGNPVFQDDFNGNSLDTSKWRVKNNNGNGDGEGQFKANMVSVANGILTIKNNLVSSGTAGRRGGWVDSKIKFGNGGAFPKYGYFEADIRINRQGINFNWIGGKIWPTWWLWEGGQSNYIPTEFDIMEYSRWTNFKANGNATSSHHYRNKASIGPGGAKKFAITDKNSPRDEFNWHKWGMLWTPTRVTFYYDGVPYGSSDRPEDAAKENVPLKLIFSSSPHVVTHPDTPPRFAPKVSDILPSFQIRSVRVWQGGNAGGGNNGGGNNGGGNGTVVKIPGTLEAENYKALSNEVRVVNIPNNKKALGYIRNNSWSEHYIDVPAAGTYAIDVYASSGGSGGTIDFTINGNTLGKLDVPKTNNWNDYKKVSTGNIFINAGVKTVRLIHKGAGPYLFNIDGFVFRNVSGKSEFIAPSKETTVSQIKIYPNPSKGNFNIDFNQKTSNVSVVLTDITGRIVYREVIENTTSQSINIQGMPRGIYILNLQGKDLNLQDKLVIE